MTIFLLLSGFDVTIHFGCSPILSRQIGLFSFIMKEGQNEQALQMTDDDRQKFGFLKIQLDPNEK